MSINEQASIEPRRLSALISQVLIAFTVELDNEFEQRIPHRTTLMKAACDRGSPWLVSVAMWSNFIRFVDEDGVRAGDFARRAGLDRADTARWLTRMSKWWGFVDVVPNRNAPRTDWIVRLTPGGRQAQAAWSELVGVIEERWCECFGCDEIARLRQSVSALVSRFDRTYPGHLSILGYGLFAGRSAQARGSSIGVECRSADEPLPQLLSQALLAFAGEFERESSLALPLSANALRVIPETGVRLADVPLRCGIGKAGIDMSIGLLARQGRVVVVPDPADVRFNLVRLTAEGAEAQRDYHRWLALVEEHWRTRFGDDVVSRLSDSLAALFLPAGGEPRMSRGLRGYPDGWRARRPYAKQTAAFIRDPGRALPHFPVVLHRGGWPDGA